LCRALAGTDVRPPALRRRASRPQLKRDPLGSTAGINEVGDRSREDPVRYAVPLIATALVICPTSVRAQTIIRPHPLLLASTPSFDAPLFRPGPILWARFRVDTLSTSTHTCPMPVVRTDSARQDPMPVARSQGTSEPMPVARSGCTNPLYHRH